ncbi:isopentenyltransferase [Parasponia andersonii]|uniref:adenylate dimethylallyltransferase (ADP/ATP-dependent) n=1 Tax=Parasponia andersonii TaxID=3476 RepID=A0A2P5CXK1_PARAD|nr:isopentenyltransferase [Parasponia andersonii]
MMPLCKQMQPAVHIPPCGLKLNTFNPRRQKDKVVIVMGATGTGKSRLSIDLATLFPAEIINSDKMQVYEGLDIVTNKITKEEQRGVPHHLLGILNPNADFTAPNFSNMSSLAIDTILGHDRLPIIVGGSNSFIEHLVDDYDHCSFRSKFDCCFLWVDVSMPVLHSYVSKRVDEMVRNGMVDEVRKIFDPNADYGQGIRRAIGVPEFDNYFRNEPFVDPKTRSRLLQEAINEIKDNNCKLACRQLGKIHRLRNRKGWRLHRLDATEVYRKRGKEADQAWKRLVAGPSAAIVYRFLCHFMADFPAPSSNLPSIRAPAMAAAISH